MSLAGAAGAWWLFLTEGLGDRPISLNEAAAELLRQAQAPGSGVSGERQA